MQILYNYYTAPGMSVSGAIGTLRQALDASYDTYYQLCGLPLEIGHLAEERLERERAKFSKDQQLIEMLQHLADNLFLTWIKEDRLYLDAHGTSDLFRHPEIQDYLNNMLPRCVQALQALEEPIQWDNQKDLKRAYALLYSDQMILSDDFGNLLSNCNFYLNDDISIIFTFVTRALKGVNNKKPYSQQLKPPYPNKEDEDFGPLLLEKAIVGKEEYRELLSQYFVGWDKERVSEIDYIIMQLAVTEALNFPSIPTNVTLNEYLDLAHYYSSPTSHVFINGILHQLFTELKKEGRIWGV